MKISIIIPARNEAARIAALIEYLFGLPRPRNCEIEIIVADGQSDDATRVLASRAGARVVETQPNRGAQQNAAAAISSGEILWFLHADARPHFRSLEYLARGAQTSKRKTSGGNFRLRFDARGLWPRVFETIARVQRKRGIYYGDSGIWARREVFERLGGFENWPLFEDFDFACRLENFSSRHGLKTTCAPLPIFASSRRFESAPIRVLAQWIALQTLFQIGVAPEVLARIYFGEKFRGEKFLRRSALVMTETDDSAIASDATTGESSHPVNG